MGHLNSFSASGGWNLNKNFPKIQIPGELPEGEDVAASIWLVHKHFKIHVHTVRIQNKIPTRGRQNKINVISNYSPLYVEKI